MYKGYKTYRHYLNAKLNALAVEIIGQEDAKEFLRGEVLKYLSPRSEPYKIEGSGVKMLTDEQASRLFRSLIITCTGVKNKLKAAGQLTGSDQRMTLGQRKAIIRICKYEFRWSPEAAFSFILGIFPDKRKRISPWEIQHSKLGKLFTLISKKDADKIIKRLDMIKKRNLQNANT